LIGDGMLRLHHTLLDLLATFTPEDWQRPTAAAGWTVKDMVAHLLDTDIRRLSAQRDQQPAPPPPQPIDGYAALVDYLNFLNAQWVSAARHISPRLLIEFLAITGPELHALLSAIDPHAPARTAVSWAGETTSAHWFDMAREYTEKWHHQQHIREAIGAPLLDGPEWLAPVLATFLRGLPHAYRAAPAAPGTVVVVEIPGPAGGHWTLVRGAAAWNLWEGAPGQADAWLRLDADSAWRLLTKGLERTDAHARLHVTGTGELALPFLDMLSIMA
jgi:uncharacterized protein (TIGR03083 family)